MTYATAMPPSAPPRAAQPRTIRSETVLRTLLFLMMAIGSISFFEPSPYEIVFLILLPISVLGYFVMDRALLAFALLLGLFLAAQTLALTPWLDDRPMPGEDGSAGVTPVVFTLQTVYLYVSAYMFAMLFARRTEGRLRLALIGYTISCIFAAAWASAGYWDLPGFHDKASIVNRIAGPFKDPNVLGSYCVLGVLCLMQAATRGRPARRLALLGLLLFTIFGGIFLPLSRGAWGALVFAAAYFAAVTWWTAEDARLRRAIVSGLVLLAIAAGSAGLLIASNDTLRDVVTNRAKLEQEYDGGVTGRFGNQKRSIPMLIERPLGFGPHRFAFYFDLDPHNSYIGAFSTAGWLGGLGFILMVVTTTLVGIRLTLVATPFREHAQVVVPTLISAFLQALQIDVDHWRFIYFMMGAVWGMESARLALAARARHGAPRFAAARP